MTSPQQPPRLRPANPATVFTAPEALAFLKNISSGTKQHQAEQRELLAARDADMIAKCRKGWTVKEIARDKGLSESHVRQILTLNGCKPHVRLSPMDAASDPSAITQGKGFDTSDAKQGSKALLRSLLLYHLRHGSIPPNMDAQTFLDLCARHGINPALITHAIHTALATALGTTANAVTN